ncbi:hypothetical protein MNBD_GAMMA22-933 [hydrothermal vent metagenome]|uniref:Uncharacterized protein n=1 Tax=hydrothermal vent metagenome TaxID=652676 RepID=A0A3B1A545_9ZZZZ
MNSKALLFFILITHFLVSQWSIAATSDASDEYLQSLDEEISSPEYLSQAKRDLVETEKREKKQKKLSPDALRALRSLKAFEELLKSKFPASHNIYSSLSRSSRVSIFKHYRKTKTLSSAKRMIINKYMASIK